MNNLSFEYNGQTYRTGDTISCEVGEDNYWKLTVGKLFINELSYHYVDCYICQNDRRGADCGDKHKMGYNYSWRFGLSVISASGDDKLILDSEDTQNLINISDGMTDMDRIVSLAFPVKERNDER